MPATTTNLAPTLCVDGPVIILDSYCAKKFVFCYRLSLFDYRLVLQVLQISHKDRHVRSSLTEEMGSTLKRLKIYYINNFRVTRHGLWLIVGVALLLLIASRLFDYRPTAFHEVRVLSTQALGFFTARCYTNAVYAVAVWRSFCPYFCPSVTSRSSTKTAKQRIT